jgi:hypothetical protein
VKSINIHSFGLIGIGSALAVQGPRLIECDSTGRCTLRLGSIELRLTEYGRLNALEHQSWLQRRSVEELKSRGGSPWRLDYREPGRDDRETFMDSHASSVINPFLEVATPDFLPFLRRVVGPQDFIVIGHCLGAGISRVQALPAEWLERTVVVGWEQPDSGSYRSHGVRHFSRRAEILDRLRQIIEAECFTNLQPRETSAQRSVGMSPS